MGKLMDNPKVYNRGLALTGKGSKLHYQERKTGTDSSQAVTIHCAKGEITSSTTNLGAKTTEDIVLTNRFIAADSHICVNVQGGGAGDVVVSHVVCTAGTATITVLNADPTNACNAAYKINFVVIG